MHTEREALLELYTETNGPNWYNNSNWGYGNPCVNQWHGVQCEDGKLGLVISILYVNNDI